MNDRFKFRAWNAYYNEMVSHEELIDFIEEGAEKEFGIGRIVKTNTNLLAAIFKREWLQDRYDLMQCTGLYDKNGKLIYEGDILRLVYEDYTITAEVFFLDGAFRVTNRDRDYLCDEQSDCIEIIGNVYENPELRGGGGGGK